MNMRFKVWMGRVLVLLLILLPVGAAAAAEVQTEEPVLNVALVWHQHQPPLYFDPTTGQSQLPWVRMHAAKDYYDMAAIFRDYPPNCGPRSI